MRGFTRIGREPKPLMTIMLERRRFDREFGATARNVLVLAEID